MPFRPFLKRRFIILQIGTAPVFGAFSGVFGGFSAFVLPFDGAFSCFFTKNTASRHKIFFKNLWKFAELFDIIN